MSLLTLFQLNLGAVSVPVTPQVLPQHAFTAAARVRGFSASERFRAFTASPRVRDFTAGS